MKVIAGKRQSGKTTKLIKLCYDNNGTFVCVKHEMERHIKNKAERINRPNIKTTTLNKLMMGQYNFGPDEKFYFDNVEWLLRSLVSNLNIEAVTVTTGKQ